MIIKFLLNVAIFFAMLNGNTEFLLPDGSQIEDIYLYEKVNIQWWTEEDAELIARLIYSEAEGEGEEGKLLVAQCVLDRLETGVWGEGIYEVIYFKDQFAKPGKLTDENLSIAKEVLNGRRAFYDYKILYFRVARSKKDWYAPYICHIGNHAVYGYLNEINHSEKQ